MITAKLPPCKIALKAPLLGVSSSGRGVARRGPAWPALAAHARRRVQGPGPGRPAEARGRGRGCVAALTGRAWPGRPGRDLTSEYVSNLLLSTQALLRPPRPAGAGWVTAPTSGQAMPSPAFVFVRLSLSSSLLHDLHHCSSVLLHSLCSLRMLFPRLPPPWGVVPMGGLTRSGLAMA